MLWDLSLTLAEASPDHSHAVAELVCCLGGQGRLHCEKSSVELRQHRTVLVPSGLRHHFHFHPGESAVLRIFCLTAQDALTHLPPAQVPALIREAGPSHTDHADPTTFTDILALIPPAQEAGNPEDLQVSWSAFSLLLAYHLKAQDRPGAPSAERHRKTLQRLCAWLDARPEAPLSLDQLAQRFGLSRTLLTREFRKHTGTSVTEYLNTRRLQKAHHLLAQEGWGIAEAAAESGFASLPYFYRRFRALYGLTPAELQRQYAGQG
nr:AraC family transcriptional regulator [uncultured Holophaga sp.]